jgi:hypothetical protein
MAMPPSHVEKMPAVVLFEWALFHREKSGWLNVAAEQ